VGCSAFVGLTPTRRRGARSPVSDAPGTSATGRDKPVPYDLAGLRPVVATALRKFVDEKLLTSQSTGG